LDVSWYNYYKRMKPERRGVNTGVVLLDLDVMRRLNTSEMFMQILSHKPIYSDFHLGEIISCRIVYTSSKYDSSYKVSMMKVIFIFLFYLLIR